jgi:hypothetical protein
MHYLVAGDTGASIKATLTANDTGEVIPLTTHTVKLYVRPKGSSTLSFTVTGVDWDFVNGKVQFPLGTNMETITPGYYDGEIEITYNSGLIESVYELVHMQVRDDF